MADAITQTDLENAHRDAVDLGKLLNEPKDFGGTGLVPTRYGGDVPTVRKLLSTIPATGFIARDTYAHLAAVTTLPGEALAIVPITDAGTHVDPVKAGAVTVPNAGVFRRSDAPAGWEFMFSADSMVAALAQALTARDKAQDWAEGAGEPGAAGSKSAKGWAMVLALLGNSILLIPDASPTGDAFAIADADTGIKELRVAKQGGVRNRDGSFFTTAADIPTALIPVANGIMFVSTSPLTHAGLKIIAGVVDIDTGIYIAWIDEAGVPGFIADDGSSTSSGPALISVPGGGGGMELGHPEGMGSIMSGDPDGSARFGRIVNLRDPRRVLVDYDPLYAENGILGRLRLMFKSLNYNSERYVEPIWKRYTAAQASGMWLRSDVFQSQRYGTSFETLREKEMSFGGASGFGVFSERTHVQPISSATTNGSNVLTITALPGTVYVGQTVNGAGIPAATTIAAQLTGTAGGPGTYQMSANANATATNTTRTLTGDSIDKPGEFPRTDGQYVFQGMVHLDDFPIAVGGPAATLLVPIFEADGTPIDMTKPFLGYVEEFKIIYAHKILRARNPFLDGTTNNGFVHIYEEITVSHHDQLVHDARAIFQEQATFGAYWPLECLTSPGTGKIGWTKMGRIRRRIESGVNKLWEWFAVPGDVTSGAIPSSGNAVGVDRLVAIGDNGATWDIILSPNRIYLPTDPAPDGAVVKPTSNTFQLKIDSTNHKVYFGTGGSALYTDYDGTQASRAVAGEEWVRRCQTKFYLPA